MERQYFKSDGLALSYLDAGGGGAPPIALHSHWMEAETFVPLARALDPAWRTIASGSGWGKRLPIRGTRE
jgi:hypothetical protein